MAKQIIEVESKLGPNMLRSIIGPSFVTTEWYFCLLFLPFFVLKYLILPAERRILLKIKQEEKFGPNFDSNKGLDEVLIIYLFIYIYAVKLKTGPRFPFFYKLKTGPIFLFFLLFIFKNIILPAERRGFLKNKQKTTKKNTFL